MSRRLHINYLGVVAIVVALGGCNGGGSSTSPSVIIVGSKILTTNANAFMDARTPAAGSFKIGSGSPMAFIPASSVTAMARRTPQSQIQGLGWTQLPGAAQYVAASPDGSIWAISSAPYNSQGNLIYHYVNGTWSFAYGNAVRLAIGPDGTAYAVQASGTVYVSSGTGPTWTVVGCCASDVSVALDGSLYAIGSGSNAIYHYANGVLTQLPGAGIRVTASWDPSNYPASLNAGGYYVVNAQGLIFYFSPGIGYVQLPGAAVQVSPTNSGGLFALANDGATSHEIFYYDLTRGTWTQEPGAANSIAANNGNVFATNAGGGIFQSAAASVPASAFTPLPALSGPQTNMSDPITLGPEQTVLPYGAFGFTDLADEPISELRQTSGSYLMWAVGNDGTATFTSPDLQTFTPLSGAGVQALNPPGAASLAYDSNYAGAGTVFPASNGSDLLMIFHAEYHYGVPNTIFPAAFSIGIARSTDGGTTFTQVGQIITSQWPIPTTSPGTVTSGAGDPCAIVAGGYIYVFYDDGAPPGLSGYIPMAVARAPYSSDGMPGNWQKLYNGTFSQPGIGGLEDDITPTLGLQKSMNGRFVSYNSYLNAYALFTEGSDGYYLSTSSDLIHWSNGRQLFASIFPLNTLTAATQGKVPYELGGAMISPDQPASEVTDQRGNLYYAVLNSSGNHSLVERSFLIGTTPSSLSVSPVSLHLLGTGSAYAQTVHVFGGSNSYAENDTCGGVAKITPAGVNVLTVNGIAAGACSATLADAANPNVASVTVAITVTTTTIGAEGYRR